MCTCALAQPCQLACAARTIKNVEVRLGDAGLESCESIEPIMPTPAGEPESYVDDISAAEADELEAHPPAVADDVLDAASQAASD